MPHRSAASRGVIVLVCLALALVGCVPQASRIEPTLAETLTPTPRPTPTPLLTPTPAPTLPTPPEFHEAPELSAQVEKGLLPPVGSRIPSTPKVLQPVEQVGSYGGAWHMAIQPGADQELFLRTVVYEPLVRWTSDWSGVEPNLVERYEVNRNATQYTFYLRQGIRWSDGAAFTTEDIRFWYQDVLLNKELTPVVPAWLRSGAEVAVFEFEDAHTFRVRFRQSNSLFLQRLATPEALMITSFPAHYAQRFHINYLSPSKLDALLSEGGYTGWVDLFYRRVGVTSLDGANFSHPDRPRLSAWVLSTPYVPGATSVVWQRNPYYWKVDTAGNQLPYIDQVVFNVTSSVDEVVSRVIDGSIDMQNLSQLGRTFSPELAKQTREDYYRFYELQDGYNNVMVIQLNLSHADPVKRQIFQSKDFRVGLSLAINRQEIIDAIYQGQGRPWQAAPRQESLFYDPQLASQYTEFNLDEANRRLDVAGFKRDSLGKRLGPDGKTISFSILVQDRDPEQIAILNMIARDWNALGIEVRPQVMELPVFQGYIYSNLHDAAVARGGSTFFYDVLLNPSNYMPYGENSYWAVAWANWYDRIPGWESSQPPGSSLRTQMERFDMVRANTNPNEQLRLMNVVMTIDREGFWNIGVVLGPQRYGVARHHFRNVPERMPSAWSYPDPAPTNPEQYFIQQP